MTLKRPRCEANHFHLVLRFPMHGAMLFLLHGIHRNNFTFQIVIPDLHHLDLCSTLKCLPQGSICSINPLNAELNPICHLLALVGAHHILHISRLRVKPSAHFRTQNAEVFFELLNNHDKDLTLKYLVEIQMQSTPE